MDISLIVPSVKTGGGNRVFIELANKLCLEHSITVVYPNNSNEIHTFNVNPAIKFRGVGELAESRIKKVSNIIRLIKYINQNCSEDIVIVSDPILSIFFTFVRVKFLYRFIQADDFNIFNDGLILGQGLLLKLYKQLCLYSYKSKIQFIFNSKYVYEQFCLYSKRKDVSFNLVHPAVDSEVFNAKNRKISNDGKYNICLVARKHPSKGLNTFLNVLDQLDSKAMDPIGEVYLISHDDLSNFQLGGLKTIVPKSDIEIADIYRSSDIFVSASWSEGFGLPPLEAMACGCCVITSKSGGVNEYAIENQNCLMFTPKNEMELMNCLNNLINNPQRMQELSFRGLKESKRFNWINSANQLLDIITLKQTFYKLNTHDLKNQN